MKVLHVIPAVAERYGGPSRAIFDMNRALLEAGVDVLVAATDADGAGRLDVPLGTRTSYQSVPSIFFPRQWSEAFKFSLPMAAWLRRHAGDFDVVHIHAVFSHACVAAGAAARRHGVPYIVRPLGTLDPWSLAQKPLRKQIAWRLGAHRLMSHAAAIHYTTIEEQRLVESRLGLSRGVVVPLGLEASLLEAYASAPPFAQFEPSLEGTPYVLVLCRLHPKKGIGDLIDAFDAVTRASDLAHWRLVVAGDGDPSYVATLKARAARSPAGDRILFPGWLSGGQKAAALRDGALMALPSRQENFGLSLVEAMALGTPVLVSPAVNLADEIRCAGAGWVSPEDPRALHTLLAEVLRNSTERDRRGEAARAWARSHFAWPSIAERLCDLYGSLARA